MRVETLAVLECSKEALASSARIRKANQTVRSRHGQSVQLLNWWKEVDVKSVSVLPASLYGSLIPFWSDDRIFYWFAVQYKGLRHMYGCYADENKAALARDYAVRRIAQLLGTKVRPDQMNSDRFILDDASN